MEQDLAARWRQRRSSAFHAAPALAGLGLLLGRGTVQLSFLRRDGPTLDRTEGDDRLLVLLAVAGSGRLSKNASDAVASAVDIWNPGDRALAAIRLALAPLPRLASPDDAYPLFLAETALDAGLSPRELLKELGYDAIAPLLKGAADQARVPAGSGHASGRWTSGSDAAGVIAADGEASSSQRAGERRSDRGGDRPIIPVVLAPEHHGEDAIDNKPSPFRPASPDEAVQHGRLLDLTTPGDAPLPLPVPESASPADANDRNGPDCPPMQADRARGENAKADRFEAEIAELVNPGSPTPKRTPETPNVTSQAYNLPQAGMATGRVSFDDCKRTSGPSPISNPKIGDMVEAKKPGASFTFRYDTVGHGRPFSQQLDDQRNAIVRKGKGRRLLYCVGSQKETDFLTGKYKDDA